MIPFATKMHSKLPHLILLAVLTTLLTNSLRAADTPAPAPDPKSALPRLTAIETKLSAPLLEQPGPRKELGTYLIDSNPKLFARAAAVLAAGGRSMTVVVGPAGLGKSGLLAHMASTSKVETVTLKLNSIVQKMPDAAAPEPDLVTGDRSIVFNRLPRAKEGKELTVPMLCRVLAGKDTPTLLLFDDVDEVHPDTARRVLAAVWKFVNDKAPGAAPCHVFCFGRAEAFTDFFADPANAGAESIPVIETRSVEAYNDPTYIELSVASAFPEPEAAKAATEKTLTYLRGQPALVRTFEVRSNGGALISAINATPPPPSVKGSVLNAMLARGGATHGRPTPAPAKPTTAPAAATPPATPAPAPAAPTTPAEPDESFPPYVRALEDAAAKYAAAVDDEGYFTPAPGDTISLPAPGGGSPLTVPARALLDRSGLIVVDRIKTATPRYRFEPFWLHRYLVVRQVSRPATPAAGAAKP